MSGGFGAGTGGTGGGVSGTGGGVSGTGGGVSGTGGGVSGTGGGVSGTGGGARGTGGGASGTGGGVSGTGGGASGTGGGGVDCSRPAVQVASGGCTLSLVAPLNCATVSFANGFVELAWSTSTTFCEGPHKLYVGGSPVSSWTAGNVLEYSLTSGTYTNYAMTRNIGGYFHITEQELAQLSAVNGQYYFRVASFYDSVSEVNTFIVR